MSKQKEEPIVDNDTGSLKVKEQQEKQPTGNETKGDVTKVKEKMKMKSQVVEESITKVDLNKPTPTTEAEEAKIEEVVENTAEEAVSEPTEEVSVIEEVTEEVEELVEQVEEAIAETEATGKPLPENIEKLINFMEETGGDLQDYVALNKDYSELDNSALLSEYYRQTKPHLDEEERDFLMDDQFSFDEEEDDVKEVKRKKLALKEQVAEAKLHLESVKSKHYEDIKMGSKLTNEQQKAIDFFNRYKTESKDNEQAVKKQKSTFLNKTKQVFNEGFKGFEYNVGEKKFRFNVKDADTVKESQSDINNFVKKFLNENNEMSDAKGYHKSLFTAMNPDAIASHFYEQGKADALKDSVAKSKNINMDPRQSFSNDNTSGQKFKVISDESPSFKFKIKNK